MTIEHDLVRFRFTMSDLQRTVALRWKVYYLQFGGDNREAAGPLAS